MEEKMVFWRKNIFLFSNWEKWKGIINETTRLLNEFGCMIHLESIAFKAIVIMPSLLLQRI